MKASIVIRAYNEAKHLPELLRGIRQQLIHGMEVEIVVVDSGSTDETRSIAQDFGCVLAQIPKDEFSFGRSLNVGCARATGDWLVFVSGHCIPTDQYWLPRLLSPLTEGVVALTYGRQIGHERSRFSECRIFEKYFSAVSRIPQEGFFCNNANAALPRRIWLNNPYDEEITGLEDMHLAKRLVAQGMKVGYVADACVFHIHDESWTRVKNRFEREAIALQHIMPEVHLTLGDLARYVSSSILLDLGEALRQKEFGRRVGEIVAYRCAQYWGAYRGNHVHRRLSSESKERYFYPR